MTLLMLGSGCINARPMSVEAYCKATAEDSNQAVEALKIEGTDRVVVPTARVIAKRDAFCAQ